MIRKTGKQDRGFTMVEVTVVVVIAGAILAFATPRITNAMREYRLNAAMRQVSDLVQRVKMQAVSDNNRSALVIDTAGRRIGQVYYQADGTTVDHIDYTPLSQGVIFAAPANVTAPVTGAPASSAVSFPAQGSSTTVFQMDFNSRGFPMVAGGAINSVYLTNGSTFRALTMNCVGAVQKWSWRIAHDNYGQWADGY
jgi:prepilin-type N-terminal cleavage/methylation domain-containing protein